MHNLQFILNLYFLPAALREAQGAGI